MNEQYRAAEEEYLFLENQGQELQGINQAQKIEGGKTMLEHGKIYNIDGEYYKYGGRCGIYHIFQADPENWITVHPDELDNKLQG